MTEPYTPTPELPAGMNSSAFNGDEFNGPGYNEPVWILGEGDYIVYQPLIITSVQMAAFADCADYVVPCQNDTIVFPAEIETLVIRGRQ